VILIDQRHASQDHESARSTYLVVRSEHPVPPPETRSVAVDECHVVEIVVVGSGPEWQPVTKRPGEIVARVGVDGLEQTEGDPEVDGENVEILAEETVEEWSTQSTLSEDQDFERVGVFSGL
jgi:hypothetical protein